MDGQYILKRICYKFQTLENIIIIFQTSKVFCVLKKNLRRGHCILPFKKFDRRVLGSKEERFWELKSLYGDDITTLRLGWGGYFESRVCRDAFGLHLEALG